MKKYIFLFTITLFIPLLTAAHGGVVEFDESQTSQDAMRYIEDLTLGDELHEEMEGLMTKMMAGTLTEQEAHRVSELMEQYPGSYGMMIGRMMGMSLGSDEIMGDGPFDKAQDKSAPLNTNQSFNSMMGFGFSPLGTFSWIFMLLWWGLILVGIIALIKWIMRESSTAGRKEGKTALDILKERYAKGEIDKKELEEKKSDVQ